MGTLDRHGDLPENPERFLVDGLLNGPGRRFRIHHGQLRQRFKWKPAGPVYSRDGKMIWEGGIRELEKGALSFASESVPVIFTVEYLEWIDPTPTSDFSDVEIRHQGRDGDLYLGLTVRTEGIRMSIDRATVDLGDEIVDIKPVP